MANDMKQRSGDMRPVAERVTAVIRSLGLPGVAEMDVTKASRLVEDLGLDSLRFVDLTMALERELGLDEFPMQEWVDDQLERDEVMTLGGLVRACEQVVAGGGAVHDLSG